MKARDLAAILMKNPDMEVVAYSERLGYSMPVLVVETFEPTPEETDIIEPFLIISTEPA